MKEHCQFCKNISSSTVLNGHNASTADTFFSKDGAIKTFFWADKIVDEDDAEVLKCLTVFENTLTSLMLLPGMYTLLIDFQLTIAKYT